MEAREALFPGWSYPWVIVSHEKMCASVSLLIARKTAGATAEDTNGFITQICQIPKEPVQVKMKF